MLSFAYPAYLFLLLLLPLILLLYWWARRRRVANIKKFGQPSVLKPLMPDVSPYKGAVRICIRLVALACLVIAFARPWGGLSNQSATREGIEVVACVDASNSMLASSTDDADGATRIDAAKLMLERMLDAMGSDRVGLVVFAENAYTLIPVSSDFASAKSFLATIDPAQMQAQGTNLADAIQTATSTFSPNSNLGKAIILFTDAEELENPDAVMGAVKDARARGIQIDVVGVGTPGGSTIQTPQGLFTDDNGEVVTTRLNEDLSRSIAQAGGGVYVNANSGNALLTLQKQLKQVKRSALQSSHLVLHDELYIYFVVIALICLVIDAFMVDRKNSLLRRITFFRKEEKA